MRYRLMNDYSADWPIWRDDGGAPDGEPQLPAWLEADIRKWAATFESLYSYETGWPDARTGQEQRLKGERLAAAIARELSLGDSIVFAPWETNVAGLEPREV